MITGRRVWLAVGLLALLLLGLSWLSGGRSENQELGSARPIEDVMGQGRPEQQSRTTGTGQQATEVRAFRFPKDHGPHSNFDTEWWYVTGNLHSKEQPSRRFGFQFTLFRQALPQSGTPTGQSPSAWRAPALWMEHSALSDSSAVEFFRSERFSREALQMAGAQLDAAGLPKLFLGSDFLEFSSPQTLKLQQSLLSNSKPQKRVQLQLQLESRKSPVFQGQQLNGLSQKGPQKGQASYYYSLPRLLAQGQLQIGEEQLAVEGQAWLDREWSSRSLPRDLKGWDWFCLQFDDGSELMFYRLRQKDGSVSTLSCGSYSDSQDRSYAVALENIELEPLDTWTSPTSGLTYPVKWRMTVKLPAAKVERQLLVQARLEHQEMPLSIRYWEGAVDLSDPKGSPVGVGFLEMVGY